MNAASDHPNPPRPRRTSLKDTLGPPARGATRPASPQPEPEATQKAPPPRPPADEFPVNAPLTGYDVDLTQASVTRRGAPPPPPPTPRQPLGCLYRGLLYSLIGGFFALLIAVIVLTYGYWYIARDLPPINDLSQRASQFETARVFDARGNLLYEIVDPQAGRRTRVPLDKIAPSLIAATLATEDKNFYSHPGFDPVGIARAIWQNLRSGETVSGASTITQQLVRALVFTPQEAAQKSNLRKIREIILAAEITRRYSKDEILELYLNQIYYGNLAYGVEAAAETYFNKPASDLTLGEAAFLAGLPQAPAVYDVYTNRAAVLGEAGRLRQVLTLMLAQTNEAGGITVHTSTGEQQVRVTPEDYLAAAADMSQRTYLPPRSGARFPHWVNYVRQLLEAQFGAQALYRSGYNIYTTLEPDLQTLAEKSVADQVATLANLHVTNGALVALRPATGEIVAMVGSHNYDDPKDGQINMALAPRQPGSSIKPLTYALAFERGWTPATLIWDVPTDFPDGTNPPYKPLNYDLKFHGPVLVRQALANSYNIPAVKALQFVGLYGQPTADGSPPDARSGLIPYAQALGITSLTRPDYGLALTLGGGEVPLTEMVGAYGALANGGRRVFAVALRRITDAAGKTVCQQPLTPDEVKDDPPPCQKPPDNWDQPVMTPETAYLIGDILADNTARTPSFGPNSPLKLSFPASVKTGTTNDFRDNWTIGYTPDLVAGVWVGNADFTPMVHSTGVTGAAPIWHVFMEGALAKTATLFKRPAGIVEKTICAVSGAEPSDFCPPDQRRSELFAAARPPLPKERDLWQQAYVDPFTGLRQTADCAQHYQNDQLYGQQRAVIAVADPAAQKWLTDDPNGQQLAARLGLFTPLVWAPTADCTADSPHPLVALAYPLEGATLVPGTLQLVGQASATKGFARYRVEYGLSHDPQGWGTVLGDTTTPVSGTGRLADWDASSLPDGPLTVRVVVFSQSGGSAEYRVHFTFQRPTATPAPTTTPTRTPTITATALPTLTPSATETPSPAPPSATPPPASDTPSATPALATASPTSGASATPPATATP